MASRATPNSLAISPGLQVYGKVLSLAWYVTVEGCDLCVSSQHAHATC